MGTTLISEFVIMNKNVIFIGLFFWKVKGILPNDGKSLNTKVVGFTVCVGACVCVCETECKRVMVPWIFPFIVRQVCLWHLSLRLNTIPKQKYTILPRLLCHNLSVINHRVSHSRFVLCWIIRILKNDLSLLFCCFYTYWRQSQR